MSTDVDRDELRDLVRPLFLLMYQQDARQIVITRDALAGCKFGMFDRVRYRDAHDGEPLVDRLIDLLHWINSNEDGCLSAIEHGQKTSFGQLWRIVADMCGEDALHDHFPQYAGGPDHGN